MVPLRGVCACCGVSIGSLFMAWLLSLSGDAVLAALALKAHNKPWDPQAVSQ